MGSSGFEIFRQESTSQKRVDAQQWEKPFTDIGRDKSLWP